MSDLEALKNRENPGVSAPSKRKLVWQWQWLVAPLMGISVLLHVALLFVPLPSWDIAAEEVEEAAEPEAEETVEILSLSDIAPPAAPAEAPPETPQPSQQQAPPSPDAAPPVPDPEQLDEAPPESEATPEDPAPPVEDGLDPNAGGGAFDPARQSALAGGGRQNLSGSEFGKLNSGDPGLVADYILQYGLKNSVDPNCFFAKIDPQYGLTPVQGVIDTITITRNPDFVPDTLCQSGYCTNYVPAGDYCGAPLYELQDNGVTQLFASIAEMGTGGSSIVSLWSSDPRNL